MQEFLKKNCYKSVNGKSGQKPSCQILGAPRKAKSSRYLKTGNGYGLLNEALVNTAY